MLTAVTTSSCRHGSGEAIRLTGEVQGSYYSIIYYDEQGRDLQEGIDSLLQDFDRTASLWDENSLIRHLNSNSDSIITPLFADILQKSLYINSITEGAFDCRVGKIVEMWGFSFKGKTTPKEEEIESLLIASHGKIGIDSTEGGLLVLHKENANTEIDFNAIAQGYSVDLVGAYLERQGIEDYLIDIGGEVKAKGSKPDGEVWRVGIERPSENKYSEREIEAAVGLKDLSLVTSGSYRKYYEKNGERYSHTIDPSTGRPVTHTLLSVSVIDSTTWRADAMATAFMVMGLDKAKQYIAAHQDDFPSQAVFFIYSSADGNKTYATPGMEKYLQQARQ